MKIVYISLLILSIFNISLTSTVNQGLTHHFPFKGNLNNVKVPSKPGVYVGAKYGPDKFGVPNNALKFDTLK